MAGPNGQSGCSQLICDSTCSRSSRGRRGDPDQLVAGVMVIVADALEGEHLRAVTEGHRRGLGERPQVRHHLLGRLLGEAAAKVRKHAVGGVQRRLHGADLARDHPRWPQEANRRDRRGRDRPSHDNTDEEPHSRLNRISLQAGACAIRHEHAGQRAMSARRSACSLRRSAQCFSRPEIGAGTRRLEA